MDTNTMVPAMSRDLAQNTTPLVEWQEALQIFLNMLGSPRTAKVYRRAVREAVETLGIKYVADVTAFGLAQYRRGLVLLRGGSPLEVVQRILGYNGLSITQRYLDHLERADLAQWAFSPE